MSDLQIHRVFVANRGEIAVRIISACKALGLETVIGVSEADKSTMGAKLADRTVCIGGTNSSGSYLRSDVLVHAAKATGCDALHPGYGFLSERADFAKLCESSGLVFVGPTPESIESMGNKSNARRIAAKANVPTVPGCDEVSTVEQAIQSATDVGYPVLLKARAGGGGKGMRVVLSATEMISAFSGATNEAKAAFGDGTLYMERYIKRGRHVEVQVFGDGQGKVVHLYERDCTVQRRHQKLIEESPSPRLPQKMRIEMLQAAVQLSQAVKYRGAGTVEFIVDDDRGDFYFLEMNTRIQVEHPVTEMSTGIDLVQEQLRLAGGMALELEQSAIKQSGHVIECRINAEDATQGFLPSPGNLKLWSVPEGDGVRIDSHCYQGYLVPPFYDSLIAKLIVQAPTRALAIEKMLCCLNAFRVEGIHTTIPFQALAVGHKDFRNADITTRWVEERLLG